MNLTRGINLRKIAELMPGASGAEVKVRICCILHVYIVSYTQILTGNAWCVSQGVCTEAGMYALRERRVHVTQEDFEMAVAKVCASVKPLHLGALCLLSETCSFVFLFYQVMQKDSEKNMSIKKLWK